MARARVGTLLCVFLLATTRVASRGDAASDDDARVASDDDDDDDAPSPRDLRNILQTSLADEAYVVRVRRELHRAPETMWNERATSSIIKRELTTMGIAHVDVSPPGVVGVVGDGSDPVVLLRADMDALPLHEQSDIPLAYRSQTPGVMHACGHDGHVAMLLGAARALARMRDERALPPGTIRFVFQPAEEGAGGAKKMLRDGLLAMTPPTSVAFALHAWPYPETPSGTIGTRPGTIMAGSAAFEITTTARTAADAVACGAAVVVETQSVVARRADPLASALVTVTAFESSGGEGEGEGEDAGSGVAVLRGQFHAMDEATFATTRAGIESGAFAFYSFKQNACHPSSLGFNIRFDRVGPFQPTDARNRPRVADGAAAARGCDASVNFSPIANGSPFPRVEYPPTINDARVAAIASDVASEMFGEAVVDRNVAAVMPAEDFSFFARRWPSVMMWFGSYNVSAGATHPLHSSKYVLDEGVLHRGVAMHVGFAVRYLEAGES